MDLLYGRFSALFYSACGALLAAGFAFHTPAIWGVFALCLVLTLIGIHDYRQTQHPVLANYPLLGNFRYLFESIRPEIRQYFLSRTVISFRIRASSARWSTSAPSNMWRSGHLVPWSICIKKTMSG